MEIRRAGSEASRFHHRPDLEVRPAGGARSNSTAGPPGASRGLRDLPRRTDDYHRARRNVLRQPLLLSKGPSFKSPGRSRPEGREDRGVVDRDKKSTFAGWTQPRRGTQWKT